MFMPFLYSRLQLLMGSIAMRRTKTQQVNGKPMVELPDRQVFIQPVELSLEERKLYDSMAKEGKLVIGKEVQLSLPISGHPWGQETCPLMGG